MSFHHQNKKVEEDNEEQSELNNLRKLNESYEIDLEDKKTKDLVGDEAVFNYYDHYKNLSKIT